MIHRGELLRKAVDESGIPKTRIVQSLNKSRRWLYNQFADPNVAIDTLLNIGKIIHYDFTEKIPELKKILPVIETLSRDEQSPYTESDAQYWKDKYLRLLEDYTALLKKLR